MRVKSDVRYELKYVINWRQRDAIQAALLAQMIPDQHGDLHGNYAITSLYYDTVEYHAYRDKIEGERFRRKVRVRAYGEQTVQPDTPVFLEIKQRQNKTLTKRRVRLPHDCAVAFDDFDQVADRLAAPDQAVLDEVYFLYRTLELQPSCIVRYNRRAFNGTQQYPDLRVTFDTELRCRGHDLTLLSTGYADDLYFLPPQTCVMEIKANQSVPYWLAKLVQQHRCTPQRVSKYCTALERCGLVLRRQRITL